MTNAEGGYCSLAVTKLGILLHVCPAGTTESQEVHTVGHSAAFQENKMVQSLRIVEGTDQ